MDLSAFLTSLATSSVIFIILLMLYLWLSRIPGNYPVYYPNRLRRGLDLPGKKETVLDWFMQTFRMNDREVIKRAGMDAFTYLNFLRSMMVILALTACYNMPVLVTLSKTDHHRILQQHNNETVSNVFDSLAMGNVQSGSTRIWAFVIGAYWMSFCLYYTLWRSYDYIMSLRVEQIETGAGRMPELYTVLVRDIPPPSQLWSHLRNKLKPATDASVATQTTTTYAQSIDAAFRQLHPDTYQRSIVVVDITQVSKTWNLLESYRRALQRLSYTKETKIRAGWLGLFGPKIDAVEFYTTKIRELVPLWETQRAEALKNKQLPAAFVVFNSPSAACAAASVLNYPRASSWTVSLAPDPRAVIWANLPIRRLPSLFLRRVGVGVVVFLTICFYMIPISAISAFTTLDELKNLLPFLRPLLRLKILATVLAAYLPQLALMLFLALLPTFLIKLSCAQGLPCRAHVERAAAGKYFYFSIFNVFLGITVASTLFAVLKPLIDHPTSVVSLLTASLPPQAAFFITFISLKFLGGYGLRLSRIVPLLLFHLKRRFLCKTEEDVKEAWKPSPLEYATLVPGDMVVVTIALCYAVISPFILPFTILYFAFGLFVMKNQVLNVHYPEYESYGRMWPHIHARVLGGLFVSQLTMLGYFGAKAGTGGHLALTVPMVALPFITILFGYITKSVFYPAFELIPLSATRSASTSYSGFMPIHDIVSAYTPTCLTGSDVFEDVDDKFDDARSTISSSSSFMSPA